MIDSDLDSRIKFIPNLIEVKEPPSLSKGLRF